MLNLLFWAKLRARKNEMGLPGLKGGKVEASSQRADGTMWAGDL